MASELCKWTDYLMSDCDFSHVTGIRQVQCILLKVALLLGVEIHEGVSFESLVSPSDQDGESK